MIETRLCKQCGEIKPIEQFRRYYAGRKGVYRTCKACEQINSREKYLSNKTVKGTATGYEAEELHKIHDLWRAQVQFGLSPPRFTAGKSALPNLDELLDKYKVSDKQISATQVGATPKPELLKWLEEPLVEEPDYYLDVIYEDLKEKYKPIVRIDEATLLPIHDVTYEALLNKILDRFYEYEDNYY